MSSICAKPGNARRGPTRPRVQMRTGASSAAPKRSAKARLPSVISQPAMSKATNWIGPDVMKASATMSDEHHRGHEPSTTRSGDATAVPTRPVKRSFSISGHRTSISLENAFWTALREIAAQRQQSLASLVAEIDRDRGDAGLSGAVRVWVLDHYRQRSDGN